MITGKEKYVFETLKQWYERISSPDNFSHYVEILDWAKRIIESQNRLILVKTFNEIPVLNEGDVSYLVNPKARQSDRGAERLTSIFGTFLTGLFVSNKEEPPQVTAKISECKRVLEKLIFLLEHDGFEELME